VSDWRLKVFSPIDFFLDRPSDSLLIGTHDQVCLSNTDGRVPALGVTFLNRSAAEQSVTRRARAIDSTDQDVARQRGGV
jgi:hypothetical protein